MTRCQAIQITAWYRTVFALRTAEIHAGRGKIEWLDRGTRVSWSELVAYAETLGIELRPTDQASLIPNLMGGRR